MSNQTPAYAVERNYRYRLTACEGSSTKYGPCEVCNKPVNAVWMQVEEKSYQYGWTTHKCHTLFGHKECLESRQKSNLLNA